MERNEKLQAYKAEKSISALRETGNGRGAVQSGQEAGS